MGGGVSEKKSTGSGRVGLEMVEAHRKNVDGSMEGDHGPYQSVMAHFGRSIQLYPSGPPALVDGAEVVRELAEHDSLDAIFFDRVHPTGKTSAALAEALVAQIAPWLERRISFGE
jgi:hypothetical protein